VILVVEVTERGTIILTEVFFGNSEATTAWGGLGVAENNFLGRGFSVEGAFVLGSDPQVERGAIQQSYLLRASTRQLGGKSLSVSGAFRFLNGSDFFRRSGPESTSSPEDFLSIRYRRIGGTLGIGFDLMRYVRMYVDYWGENIHSDVPAGAVRISPQGRGEPIDFGIKQGTSILSGVTLILARDSRSDPVLPQRGSLLTVSGGVSSSLMGSSYDYSKLTADYQHFFPLKWGHILSAQAGGGIVFGEAPFFERSVEGFLRHGDR
jgi:outer membrane protein assembly factor BamA